VSRWLAAASWRGGSEALHHFKCTKRRVLSETPIPIPSALEFGGLALVGTGLPAQDQPARIIS
jgi:hypothetical protein